MQKINYPIDFTNYHNGVESTNDEINEKVQEVIDDVRSLKVSGVEGDISSQVSKGRVLVRAASDGNDIIRVYVCQDYSEAVINLEDEITEP